MTAASMAEASKTTLLTSGFPAALRNQFVGQADAFGHVFASELSCTLDTVSQRRYTDLALFGPEDDFLTPFESDGLPDGGGDDDAAIFIEAHADGLRLCGGCHMHIDYGRKPPGETKGSPRNGG